MAIAPKTLIGFRFALGVVVDHAVEHFPMSIIALGHLPAEKVAAIEQGDKTGRRLVFRAEGCHRRGKAKQETEQNATEEPSPCSRRGGRFPGGAVCGSALGKSRVRQLCITPV